MSERWIKESEQLLKKMRALSSQEKRDRLETVRSMLFTLDVLERSVHGWRHWIRNLSLMSQFTLEELTEMEKTLGKQVQAFIEYDVEVSKRLRDKFPTPPPHIRVFPERRREVDETRGLYV